MSYPWTVVPCYFWIRVMRRALAHWPVTLALFLAVMPSVMCNLTC